jgi:hypothetical protein
LLVQVWFVIKYFRTVNGSRKWNKKMSCFISTYIVLKILKF